MNAIALSFLTLIMLAGCSRKDPIDVVVNKESKNGMFRNGFFADFPESATVTQAVSGALLAKGVVPAATNFTITTIRQVRLHGGDYTAVVADTRLGRKVVLLRLEVVKTNTFWWTRVYDIE